MADGFPPLVEATDLAHLPGAPFTVDEVDGAAAAVRGAAGWHIAPLVVETVLLDVRWGDTSFILPTGLLVSVDEVRDADTQTVIGVASYRVSVQTPTVTWLAPTDARAIEVDMTHGYEDTPLDLYAVVAEAINTARRDQSTRSLSIGPFSESFGVPAGDLSTSLALDRYSLAPLGFA